MRKQSLFMILISFAAAAALLTGCAGTQKASESNFKTPEVTLSHAEVPSYFGYWFYDNKVQPTQPANAKPGNNGAPLIYAFILNIKNPNDFPVLMDNLRFTVALEGFDLSTVNSQEQTWVPAGKTTQLRVPCVLGMAEASGALMLAGGFTLKEKNLKAWDLIEKWWTKAPDFSFPVEVRDGSAVFKADGITKVAPFKAKYP
jgi:Late embryogenesis abundant protein